MPSLLGHDPDVSLPYLVKSQVYTIPSLGAQRELRDSLERIKPDLVHASLTLSPLDFRLPELCQQLGVPLVATFHPAFDADAGLRNFSAGTQQLSYQLYAPFLARYDRVIVFSELQADLLIKLGVPAKTLAVIPNGVDTGRWCPASPSTVSPCKKMCVNGWGTRNFSLHGATCHREKRRSLAEGVALVSPAGCRLVVVGDGPLTSSLQNQFSDPKILWWGYEPDLETRVALLQCAEVFLLPSLVEGLSLALLEAMATGTACVATDAGADGEVLAGGGRNRDEYPGGDHPITHLAARAARSACPYRRTGASSPRTGPAALHHRLQHRRH